MRTTPHNCGGIGCDTCASDRVFNQQSKQVDEDTFTYPRSAIDARIVEVETLRAERDKWKWEYENLCHFAWHLANDFEEQVVELKKEKAVLVELKKEKAVLVEAIEYISHDCMHSHANCPTRAAMQVIAKKALSKVTGEK